MNRTALILSFVALFSSAVIAEEKVVMTTNDFQVTTTDFDNYLKAQGLEGEKKERALAREGAVEQVFENFYLVRSLAAEGARNEAIDKDEVEWMVANFRDRLLMERQLELEVEKEMADVDWDALALEEYKATKDQYKREEEITAAHILISSSERTEEEAEKIANTVMEKIAKGEDFAKLAEEYSDDKGSAARGGSLGSFGRGRMVPTFEEAAFAMKDSEVGDVSPLVKSRFGFHIIQFQGYTPGGERTFEEAKFRVMKVVKGRTKQAKQREVMQRYQSGAAERGLKVDLEVLKALVAQYAPAEQPEGDNPEGDNPEGDKKAE